MKIKKVSQQRCEKARDVRGGHGIVKIRHLFEPEEMEMKIRLCEHVIVEPGASFGTHRHIEEAELYYVLSGEVVTGAPGHGELLFAGDASYTPPGENHYLENISDKSAEILAIVIGYGDVEQD